jgi:DNA mismatch endonuclease (patch repair protein)
MVRKSVAKLPDAKRLHRGDIMSPEKRSQVMSRIRGKGTGPELIVQSILEGLGLNFESHDRSLAGCPDFVVRAYSLCVFVDGDFWHGWRFNAWRLKLSAPWEEKIAKNRERDRRNHRKLRRQGWRVLRLWEHQVRDAPNLCRQRIIEAMATGLPFIEKPGNVVPGGKGPQSKK